MLIQRKNKNFLKMCGGKLKFRYLYFIYKDKLFINMEKDTKLKKIIKTTLREFLNENNNIKLKDDINIIIDEFTTKYGKTLAAHSHIKRIESDIFWKLAQDIDKYLMFNYGNDTSYKKILNIIDDFTNGGALFNDNNTTLSEKILKGLDMENF